VNRESKDGVPPRLEPFKAGRRSNLLYDLRFTIHGLSRIFDAVAGNHQ
jgi:hypothetical protein